MQFKSVLFCLTAPIFLTTFGWAQTTAATPVQHPKPRVEIHCAAGVCATSIDPSGSADASSRPLLLRNLGRWSGVLEERTCYTMRSYLMAREDEHSDSTRQVGYSTCEPSSTFDVKKSVQTER
jgi:hypothetical protein